MPQLWSFPISEEISFELVRTNPYSASYVFCLGDNRILCIGREHDERFEDIPSHSVIRIYSSDGQLLKKALTVDRLRSTKSGLHPLNWKCIFGEGRIGLLNRDTLQYAEYNFDGELVTKPASIGVDNPIDINGISLLSGGDRVLTSEQGEVYRVAGVGEAIRTTRLRGIAIPPDARQLLALGRHGDGVVFLAMPADKLLLVAEADLV